MMCWSLKFFGAHKIICVCTWVATVAFIAASTWCGLLDVILFWLGGYELERVVGRAGAEWLAFFLKATMISLVSLLVLAAMVAGALILQGAKRKIEAWYDTGPYEG